MTGQNSSWDPPQDTGAPDPVESDGTALTGAEDLDEDRLHADPLEAGMDPPQQWTGATKYGTTPWEQAHDRGLEERLAEEEPEVAPEAPATARPAAVRAGEQEDREPDAYERDLGISADGTNTTAIRNS
ncbi:hypothetical protein [Nocardia sp. CA-120079]|uniref:hypothetical protein n=1 Tax=Nocardia sp. CA-120079 TaxID=3239974 RepID=UPI003D953100